jgi:hypothetical protein
VASMFVARIHQDPPALSSLRKVRHAVTAFRAATPPRYSPRDKPMGPEVGGGTDDSNPLMPLTPRALPPRTSNSSGGGTPTRDPKRTLPSRGPLPRRPLPLLPSSAAPQPAEISSADFEQIFAAASPRP